MNQGSKPQFTYNMNSPNRRLTPSHTTSNLSSQTHTQTYISPTSYLSPLPKIRFEYSSTIKDSNASTFSSFQSAQPRKRSHYLTVVSQLPVCKKGNTTQRGLHF